MWRRRTPRWCALADRMADRNEYIPAPLYGDDDIRAWREKEQEKQHSLNAASKAIYAALSEWTGVTVSGGNQIPKIRGGKITMVTVSLLGSPTARIIGAAGLLPPNELKAEKEKLKALLTSLETVQSQLSTLKIEFSGPLRRSWDTGGHGHGAPVDVVHAIGMDHSLLISLHGIVRNIRERLASVEQDLSYAYKGKGPRPNRPAYEVAREFALLYGDVTAKRPSNSMSGSTPTGPFSRHLQALFEALGWKGLGVTGPGDEAVLAVTDEYLRNLEHPLNGLPGGFWGFR